MAKGGLGATPRNHKPPPWGLSTNDEFWPFSLRGFRKATSFVRMLRAIFVAACVAAASAFTAPAALPGRVQAKRATTNGKFSFCGACIAAGVRMTERYKRTGASSFPDASVEAARLEDAMDRPDRSTLALQRAARGSPARLLGRCL